MRRIVLAVMFLVAACHLPQASPTAQAPASPQVGIQEENDAMVKEVLASIAGKEQLPAGQVFQNVKYLAPTTSRTLVSIMNGGYAKALGVRCTYCHVEGDYASDDKRPKRAAREMQAMHRMINQQLAQMKDIQTPATSNRAISCVQCHRGVAIPSDRP